MRGGSFFKSTTQTANKKYDVMPLSLNYEEKLDDPYNFEALLQMRIKQERFKYDMHNNIFTVVIMNVNHGTMKEMNDLYLDYSNVRIEQVEADS
jgi:hypothetical protein